MKTKKFLNKGWCWIKSHPYLSFIIFCFISFKFLDILFPLQLPQQNKMFARVVVDEQGRPLRTFADDKGIWRYPIKLEEVSPLYIEALLTYEDRWFWYHPGVNPLSILRAVGQNIVNGRVVSGGSTISMQVARILHPHQRTLWGKSKQIFRTFQLEWHLDKQNILELYLNTAPFGGTVEGVQAASYTYLNKSAKQLTHAEAALLAVLPQSPTRYRPDIHPQVAEQARDKVLDRLAHYSVWNQTTIEDAKLEKVFSIHAEAKLLAPLLSRRLLQYSDGSQAIKTTIDADLQQRLQDLVANYVQALPDKTSAAVLLVNNETADVKAYIGTAEFAADSRYGYVDMVQAIRSPGSTLKPFLYAMAMDEGLIHSHSLLADVPRSWGSYRPGNFSGAFHGPVSAHDALQRSLNIPAVDLLERLGEKKFVAQLKNGGLDLSMSNNEPNLAIILGGTGSNLENLVQAYMAFANAGQTRTLNYLSDANKLSDNNQINQNKQSRKIISKQSAWVINDILSGIGRPEAIQTWANVKEKTKLAWKTGTSFGFRDSWAIGVNKQVTIGVWLGRPDGTAMPGHHGRATAGPLLFAIADQMHLNNERVIKPDNIQQQIICWPLGTLKNKATEKFCQQEHQAWLIDEVVPPTWHAADADAWLGQTFNYWINDNNHLRVALDCDVANKSKKQVVLWPKVLEPWIKSDYRRASQIAQLDPNCSQHEVTQNSSLKIIGIDEGSVFKNIDDEKAKIKMQAVGGTGVRDWYVNGKHFSQASANHLLYYSLQQPGDYQIVVKDEQGSMDVLNISVM